jgi:adenylate cyclase
MATQTDQLFWKEANLIKEAEILLEKTQSTDKIDITEYYKLVVAYKNLYKQISTLTKLSDNQQNRMNHLLDRLSRYVSPPLYRKITQGKEKVEINRTKRIKLTILFSDIVDFSFHSNDMEGEALSTILNSYLEQMTNIINKWNGTLDKYIGDAILVFFGDPDFTDDFDHAKRCVLMALEMREKMKNLQQKWFALGYPEPLHIRMGISTGYVNVGNFGSSERMDYTIIGTPVNLASRLQTYAKADQILISHETWGYVKEIVDCKSEIRIQLKGIEKEIHAHEIICANNQDTSNITELKDSEREILIRFDKAKISKDELIQLIKTITD